MVTKTTKQLGFGATILYVLGILLFGAMFLLFFRSYIIPQVSGRQINAKIISLQPGYAHGSAKIRTQDENAYVVQLSDNNKQVTVYSSRLYSVTETVKVLVSHNDKDIIFVADTLTNIKHILALLFPGLILFYLVFVLIRGRTVYSGE